MNNARLNNARRKKRELSLGEENGNAGELHQTTNDADLSLRTNQGAIISDNQNTLRAGERGPSLLEDFIAREKITHFDHERIPERVVHARGFGVHGEFRPYASHERLTRAAFLQDPSVATPVFVRFSTVAGSEGSADTARDVRGFAVKFYTSEGNYDLVGNNIPVFFIQDGIKFPDLIHSVKPEPDRGFPQAQSAHDTFWDFVSLTPETMHMLMWVMSDRGIPRSYRMMEGFGVHTFRMINQQGVATFVKFHWRPKLGTISLVWDEALKISGADPDFHRRDLWNAIENGDFPEFELSVQAFDQATADAMDFDPLDATKLIPEELVPLQRLGSMVLNRNVDNFFAETDQVAFCVTHLVPGIDLSNDPLLQMRAFSYLDTQLKRLGSANFHEIPVNRPQCPYANLQRGGHMRMQVNTGRVSYDPSSLEPGSLRENPGDGFVSTPDPVSGTKQRIRAETFADHYSQARMFWLSMTEPEQRHIAAAFAFELGKCEELKIRGRMLGHLNIIHEDLAGKVARALGMEGEDKRIKPTVAPKDLPESPPLSQLRKAVPDLTGRKLALLVTDGSDEAVINKLIEAVEAAGANVELVALKVGGVTTAQGTDLPAHHALAGAPSVLFDAVVAAPSEDGVADLLRESAAVGWLHDAYSHLKVIGYVEAALPLLTLANVPTDAEGVVEVPAQLSGFIAKAKLHRIWDREPLVRADS